MKIKLLLFLFLILPLFSGCFNYQEIEDGVSVSAITIDEGKEKKYSVSIEVIKASEKGETETQILSGEGDSVHRAIYYMSSMLNNGIYLGHCESLILSKDIAKKGVSEILEYFIRNNEFRKDMVVFVSKTDTAKEILEGVNIESQIVGYEITNTVDADTKHEGNTIYSPLYKLVANIERKKGAPIASVVDIDKSNDESKLRINGCAYFSNDKLAGFLSSEETQILNILRNDAKEIKITLNKMGVTLKNISTKRKKDNDGVVISTDADFEIFETAGKLVNDKENIEGAEEELNFKINSLIYKMQKSKQIDVFKIATLYDKKGEDLREFYSDMKITTKVEIKLKGSGTVDEE